MKIELTFEQNQYLLDLGIPKEKASIWNKDKVIFKLEDFLNGKILPKEIILETDENLYLEIQMLNNNCIVSYEYSRSYGCKEYYKTNELIDGLYELTCWYYNKFLKDKK